MEINEKKKKKKNRKISKGAIVLIIGIIIILIPCGIFGGILLKASLETGSPVVGSRFDNDLQPSISESDLTRIKNDVLTVYGVEECDVVLTSAQLRVNVKTKQTMEANQIEEVCERTYDKVNSVLPISTYFTAKDTMKMYDLAVNVYNMIDSGNDKMIYYILTKNSKMDTYTMQCVSKPVDEDLAKELRGETNITTGTGDVQVEGEIQEGEEQNVE